METIDLTELCVNNQHYDSTDVERHIYNALLSLISHNLLTDIVCNSKRESDGHLIAQVEMKINGHEVNFSEWMTRLVKDWDEEVIDTAKSLINRQTNAALKSLDDAVEELKNNVLDVNRCLVHNFEKQAGK